MTYIPNNELLLLEGKRTVVTGGAVGIGFGIVRRLAEAGAKVAIIDYSEDNLAEARQRCEELNLDIHFIQADVSIESDIDRACVEATTYLGGIDILVNNAGIYPMKPLLETDIALFEKVIHVNLNGVFLMTKVVAKQMIKQGTGGKIINISSIAALTSTFPDLAHYEASKHGLLGFTKASAKQLIPHGIQVNAIAPGAIATPGTGVNDTAQAAAQATEMTPIHRMGDPDEIGKVALFMASDMASFMYGSHVVVDGGFMIA